MELTTEAAAVHATTRPRTSLANELGARIAALRWNDLSPEVIHWAHVGILDSVGVTLAGSREPAPLLAASALDLAEGPALIWGQARRVGPLDAALINGTSSHALDFDDCNSSLGGHPSVPVLSAQFALADQLGSNGSDFVTAYVAGFETECKLALAVNFQHYTKGWHPTATLGTFGAAAACARLMNLDAAQTATALALAASFASGIKANFGTMTKPLHVGQCARNGLIAARLAQECFTANPATVFEHTQGWLDVFNGPGTYDAQRAIDGWANPFDIVVPGIAIKQYPCCGSTHPAIDAMLDIVERHHPQPEEVKLIEGWIHARRLQHTNRADPNSALDAKFSLQYVLCRALADGCVTVPQFEGEAFKDAHIRKLLPRVRVAPYDATMFAESNHFGGRVRVTMNDGTVHEASVEQPLGRPSANPLPMERLRAKFVHCAEAVIDTTAAEPIADQILDIENLGNLRELSGRIAQATRP